MMKYSLLLSLLLLLGVACSGPAEDRSATPATEIQATTDKPERLLRHVVLFAFKESVTEADIKSVEEAFKALPAAIPEIYDFEWGTNNSPEGLNKGLTHCFFLTFKSEADRAAYLPHPAHKAFGELLGPFLEDVTVVDYWTQP